MGKPETLSLDREAVHFLRVPLRDVLGLGVASLVGGASPEGRASLLTGFPALGFVAAGGLSDWGLSQLSMLDVTGLGKSAAEWSVYL